MSFSFTIQPIYSEDRKSRKKCIRLRISRLRINIFFPSPLSSSQVRETLRECLRDLKVVARWENGISHTNWMSAALQRLVSSLDSETGVG